MSPVISLIVIVVLGLGLWFLADIRYEMSWNRKRSELSAAGQWKQLNQHFEQHLAWYRPLLRLFRALVLPGAAEADFALHIYKQGDLDRALGLADQAVKKAARRRDLLSAILPARAQILMSLGRYDDARKTAAQARTSATEGQPMADVVEALLDINLGRLDAALALSEKAMTHPPAKDSGRAIASNVLALKGQFRSAIDLLLYEPSNVGVFFKPQDLREMEKDSDAREMVIAMNKAHTAVTQPAIHLGLAQANLDAGDSNGLSAALDAAEKVLQPNTAIENIYRRLRACCYGLKGDVAGVENHLTRARELANQVPSRSAKYETWLAAGRAYLALGRTEASLAELHQAVRTALHPMEKHSANYWLARACDSAGQPAEATKLFEAVVVDGFDTWMRSDAKTRIGSS